MIGERYRLVAELGSGGYGRVWKARDTVLAGPLSADDAVRLAVGMLRALQAAEQSGMVHRDVKPANVMMTVAGEILLTDFGIAVNLEDPALTVSGQVVGSPEYIAPERAKGQDTTAASDLFSLGATLYEAVEGTSPFRRETSAATLAAVLLEPPPGLRRAGRLTPLIRSLLEKEPDLRPTIRQALVLGVTAPPPPAPLTDTPPTPSHDPRPTAADTTPASDTEGVTTPEPVRPPESVRPREPLAWPRADHQMSREAPVPSQPVGPPPSSRWPRTGALILGGVLVTLGVYGFLRGDAATAWVPVFDGLRSRNAALSSLIFVPAVLATVGGAFFVGALAASAFATSGPATRAVARVTGLLIGGCGAFFAMAAGTALLGEATLPPLTALWLAVLAIAAIAALGTALTRR